MIHVKKMFSKKILNLDSTGIKLIQYNKVIHFTNTFWELYYDFVYEVITSKKMVYKKLKEIITTNKKHNP